MRRFELTRFKWLAAILKARSFQPVLMLSTFFFFIVAILAGLFGTPAGSHNFAIIFVWILWWALLIVVLVPFFGRAWYTMCPIPAPGEWLQRRAVLRRRPGQLRSLHWRWPGWLRNIWLQNLGFLTLAVFSALILTRPAITAWLLLGMMGLGVALSALYEKRVFCRYVCPVGGFIGLYSLASSIELRVKNAQVCRDHATKDCIIGTERSYGCPWMVFPGNLARNTYCGLCTECLKACPKDNVAINLRPFGSDLLISKGHRPDEAYKSLIMLACAILYSEVLLGPWGWLKDWANMNSVSGWVMYAAGFLAVNLVLVPGLFWLATVAARGLARVRVPIKRLFVDYAYSLVPMGLAGWVAFSFSFVFVNGSYVIAVLSDPFGWGWDLFGTRGVPWTPVFPGLLSWLQLGLLVGGLIFSVSIAYRIGRQHTWTHAQAWRASLPISGFLVAVTLVFLRLYLG
jgi:polyferredoxin